MYNTKNNKTNKNYKKKIIKHIGGDKNKDINNFSNALNKIRSEYTSVLKEIERINYDNTLSQRCIIKQCNNLQIKQPCIDKCLLITENNKNKLLVPLNLKLNDLQTKFKDLSMRLQIMDYTQQIPPLPSPINLSSPSTYSTLSSSFSSSTPASTTPSTPSSTTPSMSATNDEISNLGNPQIWPGFDNDSNASTTEYVPASDISGYGDIPSETAYQYGVLPPTLTLEEEVPHFYETIMPGGARSNRKTNNKQKISKRKVSKRKVSKRKVSKRKVSKR